MPDVKLEPLRISRVAVEAVITGFLARTTMTITFDNPNERVMEGEVVFPLPEGAVVASYGLDIGGEMVEASVVEKHAARIAFEKEVRKGIDPGLVEWTQGNNFRTRVYPIPAKGKRTVRVTYLSDLVISKGDAVYVLPLAFEEKVAAFSLKVDVVKGVVEPRVASAGGLANFSFKKWEERYVAETTQTDAALKDDLRIALPQVPRQNVVVERRDEGGRELAHYFQITDLPRPGVLAARGVAKPERIGIAWDASLSRCRVDKASELAILAKLLERVGDIAVDVVLVRNDVSKPRTFKVAGGQAGALIEFLKNAPCDGGTDLRLVRFPRANYDYWVFFSDGLSTLGEGMPAVIAARIFAVNSAAVANHGFLRHIAESSGGAYFNLSETTDAHVVQRLAEPGGADVVFVGATYDKEKISDVTPTNRQPVGERFVIAGKLLAAEATIKIRYARRGEPEEEVAYSLKRDGASDTGLVPIAWAQKRVSELAVFAEKNRAELLALGREYHLVTPATSLLVLETLAQHLEHNVAPARSRAEMYAGFVKASDERVSMRARKRTDKIERVVALWKERVLWWEKTFDYPKNFRYRDAEKKKGEAAMAIMGARGRGGSAVFDSARPAPSVVARPPRRDERVEAKLEDQKDKDAAGRGGARAKADITVKAWDPETPYLKAMKAAEKGDAYDVYLREREKYVASPAFYLDCAEFFFVRKDRRLGLRVLTNIAELKLENPLLLRIIAHKAEQIGAAALAIDLFTQVLAMRPEEPQSYRDLALVLAKRAGDKKRDVAERRTDANRALALLNDVVVREWDGRFPEIETIAVSEANAILVAATRAEIDVRNPLDERLVKNLDADVRILLTWHTDLTDMDLWVTEPSNEKCDYSHNRTTIGGRMSHDLTQGYGPEEYTVRRAMPGTYKIQVNYYGSNQVTLTGGTTIQATVITNFGRKNEKRKSITMRLENKQEVIDIGAIAFGE